MAGRLLGALARLDGLLSERRVGYIVVGGLADYLLGVRVDKPGDIDVLVRGEDAGRVESMARVVQGAAVLVPVRWREGGAIRGLHGRILLDDVEVDVMADVEIKTPKGWVLAAYDKLLPCTLVARAVAGVAVRVPCPEVQAVADEALGRLDRARALREALRERGCGVSVEECLPLVDH